MHQESGDDTDRPSSGCWPDSGIRLAAGDQAVTVLQRLDAVVLHGGTTARLRRRSGMLQAVPAGRTPFSASFLSMKENGQQNPTRHYHENALAAALRVTPAELAPAALPGIAEWAQPLSSPSAFTATHKEIIFSHQVDRSGIQRLCNRRTWVATIDAFRVFHRARRSL
jgi:hypothetical protein